MAHLFIVLATFAFMEFWAWFMHKYVQHGPLWGLHRSHHVRPSPRPFERNDWFFVIYGAISTALFVTGHNGARWWFWVGVGIAAYGTVYFLVHDGLIHGRLPFWKKTDSVYLRALNMAHKCTTKPRAATIPRSLACCGYRPSTCAWPGSRPLASLSNLRCCVTLANKIATRSAIRLVAHESSVLPLKQQGRQRVAEFVGEPFGKHFLNYGNE